MLNIDAIRETYRTGINFTFVKKHADNIVQTIAMEVAARKVKSFAHSFPPNTDPIYVEAVIAELRRRGFKAGKVNGGSIVEISDWA